MRNAAHVIETAADRTEFEGVAAWWREIRVELVTVQLAPPYMAVIEDDHKRATMKGAATGPLLAPADVYRDLLKRLNARLTLHFVPCGSGISPWIGADLQAEIDGHSLDVT